MVNTQRDSTHPRLVYIVTHPITARTLLSGQLSFMQNHEWETFLITSPGADLKTVAEREGISILPVTMEREIHLWRDSIALLRLYFLLRNLKPDIVNAGTPKAGLLGMVAAWMARVPSRIYTLRGLRLETKNGLARLILSLTERIASACAHRVVCVSESLRVRYLGLELAKENKMVVLGAGSSNGVDLERFAESNVTEKEETLRSNLGIPAGSPVVGFVGRFTRDKGIVELMEAYELILQEIPSSRLLLLGDFETGDPLDNVFISKLKKHPQIILVGFVEDPAPYYHLMDVLAFPSHREGFPNAPLEAGASGVPAVGFRVTGVQDAIEEGKTGCLIDPYNVKDFAEAIMVYLKDEKLRTEHGQASKERIIQNFQQQKVWNTLKEEYIKLMRRG